MNGACIMIFALLATSVVNAASTRVHEAASSTPSSLGRGLSGLLVRRGSMQTPAGGKLARSGVLAVETTAVRANEGVDKRGQRVEKMHEVCLTHEQCLKKKVLCSKKCTYSHSEVQKHHVPKCTVVCKKCVPNC